MAIKDKLQIILITYNRENHVRKTFEQFFFKDSPVYYCDFIVQDNNSTDNTKKFVEEFAKKHSNVKYTKNKYNLGISGTIARAMEVANKEYVWIIGDDDKFDFSNWHEVETAINNNEKMICLARYAIPEKEKNNVAYQLLQLTFITGGIYSTSLFNDTTIKNAFDNIFTLFPHIPPIISHLNKGGQIYVVSKAIADNGMDISTTDVSYIRGYKDTSELYQRTQMMTWILGYSNIVPLLKDKNLQSECLEVAILYPDIYGTFDKFYEYLEYLKNEHLNYYYEIYNCLPVIRQKEFNKFYYKKWRNIKNIIRSIIPKFLLIKYKKFKYKNIK